MFVTLAQLRYRILCEAKLPNYSTWVLDVWNAVRDEFEAEVIASGASLDVDVLSTRPGGTNRVTSGLRKLFVHMGADEKAISRALYRYYVGSSSFQRDSGFTIAGLDPQHPIELIVGRKGKKYVYEPFNVTVTDLEGTIGHTVGDDPSDVWCFDPETLELLFVPTFRQALYKKCRCARRSDIDGGRI